MKNIHQAGSDYCNITLAKCLRGGIASLCCCFDWCCHVSYFIHLFFLFRSYSLWLVNVTPFSFSHGYLLIHSFKNVGKMATILFGVQYVNLWQCCYSVECGMAQPKDMWSMPGWKNPGKRGLLITMRSHRRYTMEDVAGSNWFLLLKFCDAASNLLTIFRGDIFDRDVDGIPLLNRSEYLCRMAGRWSISPTFVTHQ